MRLPRAACAFVATLVVCGLALAGLPLRAQGPGEAILYEDHFEGPLIGWELEPGWTVAEGALCGEGHKWARPRAGSWSDFRVQLRLRLSRGTIHLNYRTAGPNRYFIGFHQGGLYLQKQTGETEFAELAASQGSYALDAWHQVEIAGQGGHLRISVDGALALEYTDPQPLLAGGIAFETLEDTSACLDDIVVYGLRPAPTPTSDPRFTWVRTGGPLGGLGYDIRLRPDNPNLMYVTDAYAGAHLSTDRGLTWMPANTGIAVRVGFSGDSIPVFCLTVDPHDPNVIWCGTQNTRGIYRSADGGHTWEERDQGVVEEQGITFRGFTIDPRSSDIVYAAAELSSWAWAGEQRNGREFDMTGGVVYKTTDAGRHWQAVWRGESLARYIWIDPRQPDTVYVSTGIFDREAANSDPVQGTPGGEGILKSTDGGRTWAHANNGLGNLYVGTLFMHPTNPDVLLAGAGNNQYHEGAGAYLSRDGGATWKQTLRDAIITSVEFSQSQPAIAYAASADAVYRSADGGDTWQRVTGGEEGWGPPGVRAGFPIDFQVDLADPDRIYANNYGGGNFLSTDGGRTWSVASKGYTGAQARDLAVSSGAPGLVYVAARSGIFLSPDGGGDWVGLGSGPVNVMEWNAVAIDPLSPEHVIAANNWCRCLARSRDAGRSWHTIQVELGSNVGFRAIAFAPSDPSIVYAGTGSWTSAGAFNLMVAAAGIYRSADGGQSFAPANDALSQDAHVTSLAVDPRDAEVVYAATSNHGILKSSDGGAHWATANQGLPDGDHATVVALDPGEPDVVYAGFWRPGAYRSRDGGATWQRVSAGLNPEAVVSDIVFDPANPQTIYLADLESGVYRSSDGGTTWLRTNDGLRTRAVNALAISADGRHLYAATEGEGVFRLDLDGEPPAAAEVVVEESPQPEATEPAATQAAPQPTAVPEAPAAPTRRGFCPAATALVPLALVGLSLARRRRILG